MSEMEKGPQTAGALMKAAGSYRGLRERAEQGRTLGEVNRASLPSDHPMWDAWEAIKSMWPGPCTHWEDQPPSAWVFAVDDLTYEQIGNGCRNLIHFEDAKGGKEFPPSAPQFRDLCLTNFDWERQCHKRPDPQLLIESNSHLTDECQEAGRDALASMRGLFS